MIRTVPPAAIFIIGALLIPLLKGKIKATFLLTLPVIAFINLLNLSDGAYWRVVFLDYSLVLGRVDRLSMVFAYAFVIATFIAFLYALRVKDDGQHVAAYIYSGSALGAVFAGDYLSLFIFWEIMALAAAYLVWSRKTKASYEAGFRYLLFHIAGGLSLLAGILIHVQSTGSIEFSQLQLSGLASYLILIGFGVNCAFPFLHTWLTDAYPQSTVTGAVFLSVFTTKTAVYALARAFPGVEILIWVGVVMAIFPLFYAVIESDLRKILSYLLINQVGFMVVGIGIGTPMAISGTLAHAFSHIMYKSLLFMSAGAIFHQTGRVNTNELGGLHKTMPLTTLFMLIGAASTGLPLFSGFVSKSVLLGSALHEGMIAVWLVLVFASAGVFYHLGARVPYFAFFSRSPGIQAKESPINMLMAMGLAASACILIGIFPGLLYDILPYPVEYQPYTAAHVIEQLQLFSFAALAFVILLISGMYPAEMRATNLDADWLYRKGGRILIWFMDSPMARLGTWINRTVFDAIPSYMIWASKNPPAVLNIALDSILLRLSGPNRRMEIERRIKREKAIYPGDIVKHWPIGTTVLWVTLFLLVYLVAYYFYA